LPDRAGGVALDELLEIASAASKIKVEHLERMTNF
jgi:hypothetical protein